MNRGEREVEWKNMRSEREGKRDRKERETLQTHKRKDRGKQ